MIQSPCHLVSSGQDLSLPLTVRLLRLLSDHEFRSGETLARAVGLSRARVCQILAQAESLGVRIQRLPGKGYRLGQALTLLDANRVVEALPSTSTLKVSIVEALPSTNSALLAALLRGEEIARRVLVTEHQTAGRGRMGRNWVSRFGGSLTFSFGWRFAQGAAALSGLSLAIGVALVQGLQDLGIKGVQLIWPNDLIHTHRKLGGVLIEIAGDALGPATVVVGVGINVQLPDEDRTEIAQAVVDLAEIMGGYPDRNRLLASLLNRIEEACEQFGRRGFAAFADTWQALHAYQGKAVRLSEPGGLVSDGIVDGVDGVGALLFSSKGTQRRLFAGEMSLRRVG